MDFIAKDKISVVYQDEHFHNVYPELQFMSPFAELYKTYDDKELVSKLCWYVCMYADPKSRLYQLPKDIRKKELDTNFLGADSEDYPELSIAIDTYQTKCLSPIQRSFMVWKNKLEEREELLNSNPYTMDNAELMDKLVTNSAKAYDAYKKAEAEYLKEEAESSVWGGGEESLSEKGEI